jgi:hypothetical protein
MQPLRLLFLLCRCAAISFPCFRAPGLQRRRRRRAPPGCVAPPARLSPAQLCCSCPCAPFLHHPARLPLVSRAPRAAATVASFSPYPYAPCTSSPARLDLAQRRPCAPLPSLAPPRIGTDPPPATEPPVPVPLRNSIATMHLRSKLGMESNPLVVLFHLHCFSRSPIPGIVRNLGNSGSRSPLLCP